MSPPLSQSLTRSAWALALVTCGPSILVGCGLGIKGEALPDSGEPAQDTADTGEGDDTSDTSDTDDTSEPSLGDVVVDYTVSWEIGEATLELCTGQLSLEGVDSSHRTWTLWTDAGLDIDPAALPAEAPVATPVGDGNSVNPGSYRFSVDAALDPDLPAYDSAIADGSPPVCILASGASEALRAVTVPEVVPERTEAIDAVELRIAIQWTDL